MPRKPKAPYGYKPDGTPYLRKPQARFVKKLLNPEAEAALDKLAQGSQELGLYEGITGAKYEPTVFNPASVPSALAVQVGGAHYKDMPIQPVEFIYKNGIGYMEGNAIKYLCRHKAKNGLADLEKAKHYIDLLIEMEYSK